MRKSVNLKIDLLIEATTAYNAYIRFAIRMYLNMCMQVRNAIKRLAAFVTRIGFDCSVREFMASEIARLSERTAAYVTLKRFFARMNSLF